MKHKRSISATGDARTLPFKLASAAYKRKGRNCAFHFQTRKHIWGHPDAVNKTEE